MFTNPHGIVTVCLSFSYESDILNVVVLSFVTPFSNGFCVYQVSEELKLGYRTYVSLVNKSRRNAL